MNEERLFSKRYFELDHTEDCIFYWERHEAPQRHL